MRSPIAPPPITSAVHSGTGRASALAARFSACTAVAAGSVSAAARTSMPSGSSMTALAAVATRSAKPPGRCMPIIVRLAQRLLRPCTQYSQAPQLMIGFTVTRRPLPGPSRISPASSWPRMSGGTRRGSWP